MPYDPNNPGDTPVNEVRFLIGDTDPDAPLLTDGEITYLLTANGNVVVRAAYQAVLRLLSQASKARTVTVGPTSISDSDRVSNWRTLLDELAALGGAIGLKVPGLPTAGGVEDPLWSDYDWDARFRG